MTASKPAREDPKALESRAKARLEEDALGEAIMLLVESARAWEALDDKKEARRRASEALALWPAFEESKRLEVRPAKGQTEERPSSPQLRRLPGAARPEAPPGPVAAPPPPSLPSMFIEMHAEALRLAGDEKAAKARFAEAQAAVEAEVARRKSAQEWAEAFSAALSMVRLAAARGDEGKLAESRRAFIAIAREAAREALTAEYFARGKDALPREAVEAAAEQARLLGDAKLIVEVDAERASVERRTAEILAELVDEQTAAEAILSWEDSWPHLSKSDRLRRALMDAPGAATDLSGPLANLVTLAATHPTRLELQEFADRHAALVAHARARTHAGAGASPTLPRR